MAPFLRDDEDAVDLQPLKHQQSKVGDKNGTDLMLLKESRKHDLVLRVFRCLIADLCEQFNGGHPGSV